MELTSECQNTLTFLVSDLGEAEALLDIIDEQANILLDLGDADGAGSLIATALLPVFRISSVIAH